MTIQAVPLTAGPLHHFVGYYDRSPWDATGRYLLAGEVDFMDRDPTGVEPLTVGVIDLADGNRFLPLARTTAWHWQVGCRLQWLGGTEHPTLLYNSRRDDRLIAVVHDVATGEKRTLPMPVWDVTADGRTAIVTDLHRVHHYRPGYGIGAAGGYELEDPAPADQGIHRMDIATGEHRLIVSLAAVSAIRQTDESKRSHHWFNHLLFNPAGSRFIFLHRYTNPGMNGRWLTRMFTADADGSEPFLVNPEPMTSHFDWFDERHIVAWAAHEGRNAYYLFTDRAREVAPIGLEHLSCDGHCSFCPDRRWMLTDTYPDREDHKRTLILYRWPDGPRIDIGRFYSPPKLDGAKRCDLHPRWSRDGTRVCIDSAHEGSRQVYVLDVGEIVRA